MRTQTGRRFTALFLGLWLFIIFVSVVDGYLALRHRRDIAEFELNPLLRVLVQRCGGVSCLLAAKFTGTVIACASLLLLQRANARLSLVVVSLLAGMQFALLLFLLLA